MDNLFRNEINLNFEECNNFFDSFLLKSTEKNESTFDFSVFEENNKVILEIPDLPDDLVDKGISIDDMTFQYEHPIFIDSIGELLIKEKSEKLYDEYPYISQCDMNISSILLDNITVNMNDHNQIDINGKLLEEVAA